MDTNDLLQKLEPFIPEKVYQWQRMKDTADDEMKTLIDREIAHTAYRLLGNYRKKILLSLPPKEKARGSIHLGTILYDGPRWPVGLTTSELLQNLAIFGRSGAGKTNVVFHLVQQLTQRKIPWLFWDWKRTARHMLPGMKSPIKVYTPGRSLSPFVFNPFIVPPGMESNVYITQLVDVMADAFTLGDGARNILQKAIAACYEKGIEAPTVDAIIKEMESTPSTGRVGNWKITALRALEMLAFSKVTGTTTSSQQEHLNSLLNSQTIIELDALSDNSKRFLIPILSLWLYAVRLASTAREKLRLVIVIEEAHHVLYRSDQRSKESVMNRLLRQCREIGIAVMVVDQHPHLISSAALGNVYTSICLNLKDPSDINRAAGLSQLKDREKKYCSMLPVGQGIIKLQDRWNRPFLVQFPLIDLHKGAVTDDLLKKMVDGSIKQSDLRKSISEQGRYENQLGKGERYLTEAEFRFLHDVLIHPGDGINTRYHRLSFSGRQGNAVKEGLLHRGWMLDEIVQQGNSRSVYLRVPEFAKQMLGEDVESIPESMVIHEYWKRYCSSVFRDRGFTIEMEAARKIGRVDVLATINHKRIAIEIETGKSNAVNNVRHGLQSRFDQILVVAVNEQAMRKVERQLIEAGLLIPNRVILFQCEEIETYADSAWNQYSNRSESANSSVRV